MVGDRLSASVIESRWRRKAPGIENDEDIIPPSQTWEELSGLSSAELKAKYPKRYETYRQVLLGKRQLEGDVSMRRWLGMMNRLDRHIAQEHAGEAPTLKPEQMDVFQDMRDHFEQGETEGYIVLPTGVGKTVIFVELAEAFNCKTIVVVPTKDLVTQTVRAFNKFAPELSVGTYYQYEKKLDQQVTITTYHSIPSLIESGLLDPKNVDLLVLDEAHKSLTERREEVVGKFDASIILGVTATDAYAEDKKLELLLKHEIHRMHLREAIERGLLCNTAAAVVRTDIDLSTVPIRDGQYDAEQLENQYNKPGLNKATVDLYQQKHPGERAIAFCAGVKHSKALAEKFLAAGVPAAAIYGAMPKDERKEMIQAHRDGRILVLTNDAVLREGYDVPEASVCFNLKPTGSIVDATQRGGRVTRLDKTKPNKLARVYDFLPKRDPRKPMILFSAVLSDAIVLQQHAPMGGGGGGSHGPGPDPEPDPDIPGIKVTYDANEVMRVTREYGEGERDVTQEDIKAALREQSVTAKHWLSKSARGKSEILIKVSGKDLKLNKIARVFGIEGDPVGYDEVFTQLCRAIWGDAEVDAALAELTPTPEKIRAVLKEQKITANDWLSKFTYEREDISLKVSGKDLKLNKIARVFGIEGDPVDNNKIFEELCRAIWRDAEVDAALAELTPTPEKIRTVLKEQGITAKDWLSKSDQERDAISLQVSGQDLKLNKIARVFGIEGDPNRSNEVFKKLCRAIWRDAEVDAALAELTPTPEKIRTVLKEQGITAKDWLSKSDQEKHAISLQVSGQDLKLIKIARVFGVKANPLNNNEVFKKLCRAIWRDAEVDAALAELTPTPEKIRTVLKEQGITAKNWLSKSTRERLGISLKVSGQDLKSNKIARLFGIKANPLNNNEVFTQLCRAIWGDAEVDQALKELGKS